MTKSTREMSITSLCFDDSHEYPELFPDSTYGNTIDVNAVVFSNNSHSVCYVQLGGNLYSIEDIQVLLNEARLFHERLKP